jgi:CRISPR/Cas system CSM-associated protein Csm3 (group 7 of RAMP superfamily)
MSFGNRIELKLTLRLDGDLHIGAGIDAEDDKLLSEQDKKDKKKPPNVALVQRDVAGNAVIPATSLKGALKSQAPLSKEQFNRLLGEQGDAEAGKGRIGCLWLGCALAEAAADDDACFAGATKNGGTRRQGFVKTAVRIDRTSGAAEDTLLYNRETIGAGVLFTARATLFLDDAEEPELRELLAGLLAPLARDPGLRIGGQQRQGGGRLRLDGIEATRRTIQGLDLVASPEPDLGRRLLQAAAKIERAPHETIRLTLTCEGPFISMRDKEDEQDRDGTLREVTQPLCRPDCRPLLWPSSLLGALRARAAWLSEIERLRSNGGQPVDGLADDRNKVVRRTDELAALSPVERLFGVAGWRGLLRVSSLEPTVGHIVTQKMTSVTIDRFTGGGIDERLFTGRVFIGACFSCDLQLDERRGVQQGEQVLLDALLTDIQDFGLELGHGGSKGFGWFAVTVECNAAAGEAP